MRYLIILMMFVVSSAFAETVLVYDQNQHSTVVEQNADEVRSIASITKLMTAMVVLDHYSDLTKPIEYKTKLGSQLPSKTYTVEELLTAMLVKSDNGAAETLADTFPGGRDTFMLLMNIKARTIGMYNSTFADASGLNIENKSTAREVGILALAAYGYNFIRTTSTKKNFQVVSKRKKKSQVITLNSTNHVLLEKFDNIVLGKTGFTNPAGYCVTLLVEKNNHLYSVVVLGARSIKQRVDLVSRLMYNKVLLGA
jgi:D-alanyl-D-alanine endopeptidase (penicillin-binding protein 7)